MGDSWSELDIPDAWTATAMLRNLAVDYLTPGEAGDGLLDEATRERMTALVVMGHLEVADKVAQLLRMFGQLVSSLDGDGA